jgi:iron complex outermembrane receptor protein
MNHIFSPNPHRRTGRLFCLLSILSFATVSLAQRQDPRADDSDELVEKDGKVLILDAFTVTETQDGHRYGPRKSTSTSRIAVDFQDLPQMVVSLPKELMQDVAAFRLEDIIKFAGGATRGPNANGDNYVIRGLASVATGATVDGAPSTSASDRDLFFFERVDVIKGPSHILAPTGPAGGTVNLISKSPESEFQAYARVQAGQYDANRVEFDVTGPTLNGAVDYRFGAAFHNADGYHDYTHREKKLLLGGLRFNLTDRNKITL